LIDANGGGGITILKKKGRGKLPSACQTLAGKSLEKKKGGDIGKGGLPWEGRPQEGKMKAQW